MMDFYSSRCDCSCPIAFVDLNRIISVIEWQHHVHNDITTGGPLDLISVELDAGKDSPKTNASHSFSSFHYYWQSVNQLFLLPILDISPKLTRKYNSRENFRCHFTFLYSYTARKFLIGVLHLLRNLRKYKLIFHMWPYYENRKTTTTQKRNFNRIRAIHFDRRFQFKI